MTPAIPRSICGLALLATLALGCGGHPGAASEPGAPPPPSAAPAAMRWVPAHAVLAITSPEVIDAQRNLHHLAELAGGFAGIEVRELGAAAQGLIGVDIFSPEAVAAIGVDLHGSWALYSSGKALTLVAHLAAPDKMAAFTAHQRERGLQSETATVDGVAVSTADMPEGTTLSWAIDHDWIWLRVGRAHDADVATWFTASHAAHATDWTDSWTWASQQAHAGFGAAIDHGGIIGFFDLHAAADQGLPGSAQACSKVVMPFVASVHRIAIAVGGDDKHITSRVAFETTAGADLERSLLAPPPGWPQLVGQSALAVQWNADLMAALDYFAPCLELAARDQMATLRSFGVRTARVALIKFDADKPPGEAAFALDLVSAQFFDQLLDRIPFRKHLESTQDFHGHKGAQISTPWGSFEYALSPTSMVASTKLGTLDQLFAPAPAAASAPPIVAFDIAPPMMTVEQWAVLIQAVIDRKLGDATPASRRAAEHLLRWRTGHFAIASEPHAIVITASGEHQ
jgi:hypothetical protein